MASTVAKAQRLEAAMTDLRGECAEIASRAEIAAPDFAGLSKDTEIARAEVLERIVAFLRALTGSAVFISPPIPAQPEPPSPEPPEPTARPARPRKG